jgi:hypothetical protein
MVGCVQSLSLSLALSSSDFSPSNALRVAAVTRIPNGEGPTPFLGMVRGFPTSSLSNAPAQDKVHSTSSTFSVPTLFMVTNGKSRDTREPCYWPHACWLEAKQSCNPTAASSAHPRVHILECTFSSAHRVHKTVQKPAPCTHFLAAENGWARKLHHQVIIQVDEHSREVLVRVVRDARLCHCLHELGMFELWCLQCCGMIYDETVHKQNGIYDETVHKQNDETGGNL